MPSSVGYLLASVTVAAALFFAVWGVLSAGGDETPWLPASLAAGVVVLIAGAGREVVMRRAWTRYALEMEALGEPSAAARHEKSRGGGGGISSSSNGTVMGAPRRGSSGSVHASATALRDLQGRLAEAEAQGAQHPEAHLAAYRLCEQYLADTEDAIRKQKTAGADARLALRAGQERVRELQRHHLLAWARGETKRLMHEARRRVRMSDKIETAQGAADVIGEALKIYPSETELRESATAVRDFVASVKIAHWVELAERAAFRGRYARAIARYRDALFYVSRAEMGEDARDDAANRISREIELLRARLATGERPVKARDLSADDEEDSARFERAAHVPTGGRESGAAAGGGTAIPGFEVGASDGGE